MTQKVISGEVSGLDKTERKGAMKAVAMLSGGLDSRLAVRMLQEQGIEVTALNYITPFCTCTAKSSCRLEAKKASEEYAIDLKVFYVFEEFIEIIKAPRYGHGSGVNPCLDCRILMFKKAREFMDEIGAAFLVTGEVLGERPMSQRADAIRTIEKESGLEGLIVRPLSARLLEPSIPERLGWVNRDLFENIAGRSRKPQMALAEKLGVNDYPCAAGGCLLTDKDFASRMRALLKHNPYPSRNDLMLLKVGRHRMVGESRIVIGRNEKENFRIQTLARDGDLLMEAADYLGPITVIRGEVDESIIETAAALTAGYGKGKHEAVVDIEFWNSGETDKRRISVDMKALTGIR